LSLCRARSSKALQTKSAISAFRVEDGQSTKNYYVEIKCQLDATDEFLLQILLLPAARKPDTQPSTPHCTDNLKAKHKYDRQQPLV
jgi:hypothetical protein